ncbi:Membrane protease subunit, stomatin/prohibitin family, contains C-terminal Zn-ribbon domain [Paenibacillus sp. 1_12]|uniref:SPFH domain-containing protein n=1 Tax=Paenibacillus sp. 1_12 TaxID=1566278 RepID=UPI0008E84ED0|nr:SPFH domain-containing protein [Paenibacillus sp. 1_12]SFM22163.1 Membrane protease subunit, stomatin/prohibitin family, contains C-terminal Zn-ribbon domain [Paenibacillus sp. 1_12]
MAIIDVIKFNGIPGRNWLVYRYPGESFVYGTQLIVGEGQIAVFVKGGKALDYFSAGTYTLNAPNIPILQSLINIPFGGRTPLAAEVFFINKTVKLDVLWGTSDPISLIDPKYSVRMRVRAFGQFGIKITDYRVFLTEIIGAVGDDQIVKYDVVLNYFKGVTVTKVKTIIADTIINQKISVLDIAPRLEEISETAQDSLSSEFDRFGIQMINFNLSSINFPDEDFETINKILGEKAAFDIIGDNRYQVKRSFDVMETAAGNEGGGSIASAGLGLGLGTGAGQAMGNLFSNTAGSVMKNSVKELSCKKCGEMNEAGAKFCCSCGEKLVTSQIDCYSCGTKVDGNAKFCSNCGKSMMSKACPRCHTENKPGTKFCSDCGTKLEE